MISASGHRADTTRGEILVLRVADCPFLPEHLYSAPHYNGMSA